MGDETWHATAQNPAFDDIAALVYRESGLKIPPEKFTMVQSRLRHRLRALNISDFTVYAQMVCARTGAGERRHMISALTTNVSHFFREAHHFDILTERLLDRLRTRMRAGLRIRVWSAGCSNGQEPYSIAMHLLRAEPGLATSDFRILATDIDPGVVAFAQVGTYGPHLTSRISNADKATFMTPAADGLTISEQVRRCVTFRELNLLADWPMRHGFDAIFCRNVVIYFDLETQEKLWPRFHAALAQDGVFFLGHSERIARPALLGFKTIGPTAYQKSRGDMGQFPMSAQVE
jgi:chemotaxis protein methyltransferase CheR